MGVIGYVLAILATIIFSVGWILLFLAWISVGIVTLMVIIRGFKKLLQARK